MKSVRRLSSSRLAGLFLTVLALWLPSSTIAAPYQPFNLHSGDRVVLIGDTLIEREQTYGYLEARLSVRHPADDVVFRNLGWSADTPSGGSRASFDFDKPGKGFELLKEEIGTTQPTVVIVGYGMANSFDGEAGLPQFKADLEQVARRHSEDLHERAGAVRFSKPHPA